MKITNRSTKMKREMIERKRVYLEEYLEVHNKELVKHPRYRVDMKFTHVDARGNIVFDTHDNVTNPEDIKVLEEVVKLVAQTHKLIIP